MRQIRSLDQHADKENSTFRVLDSTLTFSSLSLNLSINFGQACRIKNSEPVSDVYLTSFLDRQQAFIITTGVVDMSNVMNNV